MWIRIYEIVFSLLLLATYTQKRKEPMRKILLLFSALLTLFAHGQTSVYHSFPDSNAIWNFESTKGCGQNFDTWGYLYSYVITEDTIIKNNTYHKLNVPIEVIVSNGQCDTTGTWTNPGHYAGVIRQDIPNKKVFFIPPTDTTEQLLYDFNMQIGDTVKGYIENTTFPKDRVLSIDSVLVGGNYRKRWSINSYYNIYFIEGIGSTYSLIERSPGSVSDNAVNIISCFSQNGSTLYPNNSTNCSLITSVNCTDKISNKIKISPNPSNGSFTVDFDQSITEISLTDLLGNIILKHQPSNQTKFKVDNLSSGTYLLTATDRDGKTTNKKVISCP